LTYLLFAVHIAQNPSVQVSGMPMMIMNTVKKLREERLMSKAELARLAGVSPITVDRIERGEDCRMETKRKILLALGFSLSEKKKVFQD